MNESVWRVYRNILRDYPGCQSDGRYFEMMAELYPITQKLDVWLSEVKQLGILTTYEYNCVERIVYHILQDST